MLHAISTLNWEARALGRERGVKDDWLGRSFIVALCSLRDASYYLYP